jgi:alkaline phosphatase
MKGRITVFRKKPIRNRPLLSAAIFLSLLFVLAGFTGKKEYQINSGPPATAKTIIFMVPDGMGLADVTAARIFKNGLEGANLSLETLSTIGYQRTHSADSSVTDSAAAASAWANGDKFRNGEISCHDNDQDEKCEPTPGPTILETAKEKGKSTGLVVTSSVTDATPAAFGAHVPSRDCEKEIARQFVQVTGVDVILGGGLNHFRSNGVEADKCGTFGNFTAEAEHNGYDVVYTGKELNNAVAKGSKKILGLFARKGKTPELFRINSKEKYRQKEPTLPQMTAAALKTLEEDKDGFFLLVEGSQIDWANHHNDVAYQVAETLAFDAAVQVVLNWIAENPSRSQHTLVIIAPDHETGGFAINDSGGRKYQSGDLVDGAWTTREHTAGDVPIWSQGPGSEYLGRAVDNTDVYKVMREVLR